MPVLVPLLVIAGIIFFAVAAGRLIVCRPCARKKREDFVTTAVMAQTRQEAEIGRLRKQLSDEQAAHAALRKTGDLLTQATQKIEEDAKRLAELEQRLTLLQQAVEAHSDALQAAQFLSEQRRTLLTGVHTGLGEILDRSATLRDLTRGYARPDPAPAAVTVPKDKVLVATGPYPLVDEGGTTVGRSDQPIGRPATPARPCPNCQWMVTATDNECPVCHVELSGRSDHAEAA